MPSTLRTVLTKVETTLLTINGTGSFSHDLTVDDAIQWGWTWPPPADVVVYIETVDGDSRHGPPLGRYDRDPVIQLEAFVATTDGERKTRMLEAADLLSDIMRAFEASRSMGGDISDLILRNWEVSDSTVRDVDGYGYVRVEVHPTYTIDTGV